MSSGGESSGGNQSEKDKNDALYENREPKKIIRIITVLAYMFSVSFVGIVLSAYYIFLWHPPNPRLMHAQAMSVQAEARVDVLGTENAFSKLGNQPEDLLDSVEPESETLKIRREIVKNVNAILRANFEKSRSSDPPSQDMLAETMPLLGLNDTFVLNSTSGAVLLENTTDSLVSREPLIETYSISTEETGKLNDDFSTTESLITSSRSTTASTVSSTTAPPIKRTRHPPKKQHQTPFALKHLEVPIKSDLTRRRPLRITTTSTRKPILLTDEKVMSFDKTTPAGLSTSEFPQTSDNTNPYQTVKSLYRTLTTPSNEREGDYASSTDIPFMPSISSDQFQAVPRASIDDYHDATIQPVDDLMDD